MTINLTALILSVFLILHLPVLAITTVHKIKQSDAMNGLSKISVWSGSGLNISFYELPETIKRVWLDDPSQILVDFDGCLERAGNCHNDNKSGDNDSKLIHLRQINRVKIPGLPQTHSSLLTVITESKSGERKVYQFQVSSANGNPQYSQIIIVTDAISKSQLSYQPIVSTFKTIQNIRNGMAVAKQQKLLLPNGILNNRLEQLIDYLTLGDDLLTAANKAIVSIRLLNKLIQLGSQPPPGTVRSITPLPNYSRNQETLDEKQ